MGQKLPETTLHRLDVQGWDNISEKTLADVAPWQRLAYGLGVVWVAVTGWAFWAGHTTLGYILGVSLCCVALLVATTDICIPSMTYRAIFGPPKPRQEAPSEA